MLTFLDSSGDIGLRYNDLSPICKPSIFELAGIENVNGVDYLGSFLLPIYMPLGSYVV